MKDIVFYEKLYKIYKMVKSKNKNRELKIFIPISPGELFDKITILEIKYKQISDPHKLKNIKIELSLLKNIAKQKSLLNYKIKPLITKLRNVNKKIWNYEIKIRNLGNKNKFNQEFINTAKNIYKYNDLRGIIKKEINKLLNSYIIEEKSYIP